jgi:hypothetical protein
MGLEVYPGAGQKTVLFCFFECAGFEHLNLAELTFFLWLWNLNSGPSHLSPLQPFLQLPPLFCFSNFSNGDSCFFPELASDCDPSTYAPMHVAGITGVNHYALLTC